MKISRPAAKARHRHRINRDIIKIIMNKSRQLILAYQVSVQIFDNDMSSTDNMKRIIEMKCKGFADIMYGLG
jgi:hypothetical protein